MSGYINESPGGRDEAPSLMHLLRYRALHEDGLNRSAFTFLPEGEAAGGELSYAELDLRARAIAAWLQSIRAGGERVLLLYPSGLDFIAAFFGCIYSGAIAVPVSPPSPARLSRMLPKFRAIAGDCQPLVALSTATMLSRLAPLLAQAPELRSVRWLATDEVGEELAEEWRPIEPSRDDLAYLQYTSGSTSAPKGVMISHGNVLYHAGDMEFAWNHTPGSLLVNWTPHFHDLGLIYGVLVPIYSGISCVMMPPVAFLQRPLRWLEVISRYQATHSPAPNFAFDLCVRKTTAEQRATLDLGRWRVAANGGEPIRRETLVRFAETFADCGFSLRAFCPAWGLAEGTLKVTSTFHADSPVFYSVRSAELKQGSVVEGAEGDEGVRTLVGNGPPFRDTEVVIVDPETQTRCAQGRVGEIWISGSCVAQGYWNRPDETARTFHAYLAGTGEGPFLRTGDLGFLKDGLLFVAGRLKDLIIIRGNNHYPQDIELTAERSHPALRPGCGAAFAVEMEDEERLVLVHEVERHSQELDEIIRSIRQSVAEEHEVQVSAVTLIKAGSIPKTTSGKIQRSACRADYLAGELSVLAEWTAGRAEAVLSPRG